MATKTEADGQHPPGHYLVVENAEQPSTWHLRVHGVHGQADHHLMGAAWAALHGGYRGNKYEGPNKAEALSKLKSLYESEGMDLPSEAASEATQRRVLDDREKAAARKLIGLSELSFDRIRDLVNEQLEKYFSDSGGGPMARVTELYPSCAIVEFGGKQYRVAYAVKSTGVEMEKPEQVSTKYVPTSEADAARVALMAEVEKYAAEHSCQVGVAMAMVTRLTPQLWERYSRRVMRLV